MNGRFLSSTRTEIGVIAAVDWFVARILRDLVGNLLSATGVDSIGERAGLRGTTTLSGLIGLIVHIFVFVPAPIAAPAMEMLSAFMAAISNIFGAEMILAVAYVAAIARFGILGIVIAMGLRAMGVADDIVDLAFGLTLGSVAVAVALSFGLGGREAAGRQMGHWLSSLRGSSPKSKRGRARSARLGARPGQRRVYPGRYRIAVGSVR